VESAIEAVAWVMTSKRARDKRGQRPIVVGHLVDTCLPSVSLDKRKGGIHMLTLSSAVIRRNYNIREGNERNGLGVEYSCIRVC